MHTSLVSSSTAASRNPHEAQTFACAPHTIHHPWILLRTQPAHNNVLDQSLRNQEKIGPHPMSKHEPPLSYPSKKSQNPDDHREKVELSTQLEMDPFATPSLGASLPDDCIAMSGIRRNSNPHHLSGGVSAGSCPLQRASQDR